MLTLKEIYKEITEFDINKKVGWSFLDALLPII